MCNISGTEIYINIMSADSLASGVARTSAMLLDMHDKATTVVHEKGFRLRNTPLSTEINN